MVIQLTLSRFPPNHPRRTLMVHSSQTCHDCCWERRQARIELICFETSSAVGRFASILLNSVARSTLGQQGFLDLLLVFTLLKRERERYSRSFWSLCVLTRSNRWWTLDCWILVVLTCLCAVRRNKPALPGAAAAAGQDEGGIFFVCVCFGCSDIQQQ